MDRGAWQATVHGVAESDMTERLHFTSIHKQLDEIWEVKIRRSKAPSQPFLQHYQKWKQSQRLEHLFFFFFFLQIWHRSGASSYRFFTLPSKAKVATPQAGQFCGFVLELFLEAFSRTSPLSLVILEVFKALNDIPFHLACMHAKLLQSCLTLCDPTVCSLQCSIAVYFFATES